MEYIEISSANRSTGSRAGISTVLQNRREKYQFECQKYIEQKNKTQEWINGTLRMCKCMQNSSSSLVKG